MAIDFSKYDKKVDLEGLKKDVEESSTSDFKEVPTGKYVVEVNKLELGESSKNDPMVKAWFKIVEGEYKGSIIFMNQVLTKGFQIHIVNELLRSFGTKANITFESYSQYADLLLDVFEEVNGNFEYTLNFGEKNGFNTFKIEEIFELE